MLVWNLILAIAWAALYGEFTLANLGFGFVLGYAVLWAFARRGVIEESAYVRRVREFLHISAFFFVELIKANVRMAIDAFGPPTRYRPGIVAVPLDLQNPGLITTLCNMITLTPGTLALDVSPDRKTLYIHTLYGGDDRERTIREIKDGFERLLRRIES